jgi:DamX protein
MTTSETGQFTSPDYLEALSLYCAPYENRLDPKFFYAGTALMQRLDLLTHLTQFGESVVVVTGPPGSGKSTLMRRFVDQANTVWRLCVLDGSEMEQMTVRLSQALGIDAAANENDLVSRWAAQADASQLLVILIDNAEQLDQPACNRLCGLLGQPQSERIRIILFGSQDIQQRVKQALEERACSRTTQMLEVPRLSAEETSSYLMYRLAVAGFSGESPFTATEVRAICKAADGRPAEINRLAHDALADHHARASSRPPLATKTSGRRQRPLWLSASLGILVVAAYVGWQRLSLSLDTQQQLPQLARNTPQQEIPLRLPEPPPANALVRTGEDGRLPVSNDRAGFNTQHRAASAAEPGDPQQSAALRSAADPQVAENTPDESAAATVVALQRPEATEPQTTTQQRAEQPPLQQPAADLATAEPEQPAAPEAVTAVLASQAESSPDAEHGGSGPHREAWLLRQPPKSYSLQLLGSRSEKSVTRFIEDNRLDLRQTAYYRGKFKDSEWFVLLYGLYPSRSAALEARERLPAVLRKGKPWPRSLESVHSAIREMTPQQDAATKP